ncbi:MAG: YggT family protein [Ruminococcaceae bacterium]|jgi:YggT family protein|nr:YggT family protein [Oscillospiraceae bacterium]
MILYTIVRRLCLSVLNILQLAMLVRAVMSWIPQLRGSQLQELLYQVTEPIVMPFRKLLSRIPGLNNFPLDISFLLAWIAIDVLMSII